MSLVVFEGVGIDFAERTLFDDVGLRIGESDRVGLVGPNGSGKTTLLRLIAGGQQPDRGNVRFSRGLRVGYLPQELVVEGGRSLGEMVLSSVPGRDELYAALAQAEEELNVATAAPDGGDPDEVEHLGVRIAELHEKIDHFERFYSQHEALSILAGLGFKPGDENRDIGEFSGGWRMRGVLASILFQRPDLMLLDEPTNHLDLPSVAWFASFLSSCRQAFVLISHDREFLNEQIKRVVSLELEGVRQYSGNYEQYKRQRAEEEEILEGKAKNLAREREHVQEFIERFRYKASKAAAVQSRVKALAKMEDVQLFQRRKVMRFNFPATERGPGEVLRVEGLRKSYGDNVVLKSVDLVVKRGEKIAIIGANGAGKTTLLRVIAGEIPRDSGEVRFGNRVEIGYYAQHHADTLTREATAFQEVSRANPNASPNQVRSALGAFLFSGDDVEKKIAVLSGGERARVALGRLLIKPGNLLLMDEPTNHLDLDSSESLGESLGAYDGTLIFVSHNRSLIRRLATRIWNVEHGGVETYPGTLDEYLYSCQQRAAETVGGGSGGGGGAARRQEAAAADAASKTAARESREDEKERKRREAEARKQRSKLVGPIEKRVRELETKITALETAQAERSTLLSDSEVYADAPRRDRLLREFQDAASDLEECTAAWEKASEELEKAEKELESELAK